MALVVHRLRNSVKPDFQKIIECCLKLFLFKFPNNPFQFFFPFRQTPEIEKYCNNYYSYKYEKPAEIFLEKYEQCAAAYSEFRTA